MIAGVFVGRALGFGFETLPILLIALASLVYNALFAWVYGRFQERLAGDPGLDRLLTLLEVIADYLAMFLLIHFTGGVSSPLVPFLLFHVIIAAVQFTPGTAYALASVAAAGLWILLLGEILDWIPCYGLTYHGQSVHFMDRPIYAAAWLLFFTATLFIAAALVSRVMGRLRSGVADLARTTRELTSLNNRLSGLYAMVGAIGTERHLQPILDTVTAEMTKVMEVPAATIKLLSRDGEALHYVASEGLPKDLVSKTVIQLDQSPLNRRVIDGETLLHPVVEGDATLQLGTLLSEMGIQSAAFAPLQFENRVIGTMGVFARRANRFDDGDTEFLKLAAKLVAIAIEDARANEAVEDLMAERTRFMLQVAHNLRAPLSAGLSMMDLLKDGYMGEVSDKQVEYLRRIEDRLRSLDQTISELLTIARTRDWSHEIPDVVVDLEGLAAYTERTFRAEAASKDLRFEISTEPDLPKVDSGADLLEKVMENLVSNAIKYTPVGGEIKVRFERGDTETIQIVVRDTGIGIPANEQDKLFKEFFRASNAKRLTTTGTGLGLALVKQTVERHNGELRLTSTEGQGTEVTVSLPIHQPGSALS
jgi:signal transduction histidine kinase